MGEMILNYNDLTSAGTRFTTLSDELDEQVKETRLQIADLRTQLETETDLPTRERIHLQIEESEYRLGRLEEQLCDIRRENQEIVAENRADGQGGQDGGQGSGQVHAELVDLGGPGTDVVSDIVTDGGPGDGQGGHGAYLEGADGPQVAFEQVDLDGSDEAELWDPDTIDDRSQDEVAAARQSVAQRLGRL